jgi:PKD repeat protein
MNAFRTMTALAMLVGLLAVPLPAAAQTGLTVTVGTAAICGEAQFVVSVQGGTAPYELTVAFGDGETLAVSGEGIPPTMLTHTYAVGGAYTWSVTATSGLLSGQAGGTLAIGPAVTLNSDPFPPLLPLVDGQATVSLTAEVAGGAAPLTYAWTLDGASASTSDPASPTASATYSTGGKFTAAVSVTDACGLTAEDTLVIVVDDPLAEGCHPTAQWIADAVSTLYPQQAEQLYTCEDIYGFFTGGLTGSQLGFGQMRHAYKLALTIPDLTWEEILDWKLDGNGWGKLVQLDRVADALGDVGIAELIERVASGENSVADIRAAARMVGRYEADFTGALDLLTAGANNGELGQIYRAADELGVDPAVIAGYQEMGVRTAELEQAARLAERLGTDWASVLEAHSAGESWGSIRKGPAETDAQAGQGQDQDKGQDKDKGQGQDHGQGQDQSQGQGSQSSEPTGGMQQEVDLRVAAQLAAKYRLTAEQVLSTYTGACSLDWGCVRTTLGEQTREHGKGKNK